MEDLIKWLRKIEHLAGEVYMQAASIYADDPKLKYFFEHIAEDEAWHYHVMGSAAEYLASIPAIIPVISVDKETKDNIVKSFTDIKVALEQNTLSRVELIEKIVEAELSEWNDIFLYVVNVLKEKNNRFIYPAARLQSHKKEIECFFEKTDNHSETLKKLTTLPPVWVENILIVDDEEMITDLLKAILSRSGNIDVARNGQEALKLIEGKFYKLIISDIDMPIMDGLSLYKEAVTKFPTLKTRFLFITGNLSNELQKFFNENKVKYIGKPMEIKVLRKIASEIFFSK